MTGNKAVLKKSGLAHHLIAYSIAVFYLLGNTVVASQELAWQALQRGGHVALVRHTDAPGPSPDPPGFVLSDCSTQRNLSNKGRQEKQNSQLIKISSRRS